MLNVLKSKEDFNNFSKDLDLLKEIKWKFQS